MTFSPQPKPKGTRREAQRRRRLELERIDRQGNVRVHERSGGQCEFRPLKSSDLGWNPAGFRCARQATQVHHFLGGIGVRGRLESAAAQSKIHVCLRCHDWLEQHPAGVQFDLDNAFATLEVLP